MRFRLYILAAFLLCLAAPLQAWDFWPLPMANPDTARSHLQYSFDINTVAASGDHSPLWIHANTNANISPDPYSATISAGISKPATRPARWFDYDGAAILAARFSNTKQTGYFRELYAHIRLYIIDLTAGIHPFSVGSQDPDLTSGGLLFSNNAQPLPRLSIGIDRYTPFPGLYGYLEVKGGLTQGWFVDSHSLDPLTEVKHAMLHHKFIGARIGGKLPVNLAYQFHHAAQWGGTSPIYGDLGNSFNSFKNVFFLRSGGNNLNDQLNAEGNHIGFQELTLTFKYHHWHADLYWQSIFEDKSASFLGTGMNAADGLWGLNIKQSQWSFINNFTYEFLNTTHQDGPYHDKDGIIYGGQDNYFNNLIYRQGWTHFHQTIGSPLLSPSNNRVRTHFAAVAGDIFSYQYRLLTSYTRNWGTYRNPYYSRYTSLMLEVTKVVPQAWNLQFGITLAADFGSNISNSFGAMLTVRKTANFFNF